MYRIAWWAVFGALALVGLGLGLVHHPLWVVVLATVGAMGGATWARVRQVRGPVVLAAGAVPGAVAGLLPVLQGGLVLVAVLLLASAPGALSAYDRWAEAAPRTSRTRWKAYAAGFAPAAPTLGAPRSVRDLSDEQLRRAWHDDWDRLLRQA